MYAQSSFSAPAQGISQAQSNQFDLSAPVIHFGTAREVQPRQVINNGILNKAQDDKMQSYLVPLTKEQKLLTIFLSNIPSEFDDYWMERVLKVHPLLTLINATECGKAAAVAASE